MKYWLMKSEPETFGIEHLKACPNKTDGWDGVRNYQARNMMRDEMKKGDLVLFYHSNCKTPGIVGIMKVVNEATRRGVKPEVVLGNEQTETINSNKGG